MAPTSKARDSEKLTKTQQAILQVEEEIFTAVKNQDTGALERILTDDFVYRRYTQGYTLVELILERIQKDDFVYRSPGSQEVAKDDFLKLCASFPYKIISIWGEELKVNVYGNTAVLTGLQFAKTQTSEGKEETSAVMFTDVFVKQKGKWMLSLAHAVDLPQIPDKYLQKK